MFSNRNCSQAVEKCASNLTNLVAKESEWTHLNLLLDTSNTGIYIFGRGKVFFFLLFLSKILTFSFKHFHTVMSPIPFMFLIWMQIFQVAAVISQMVAQSWSDVLEMLRGSPLSPAKLEEASSLLSKYFASVCRLSCAAAQGSCGLEFFSSSSLNAYEVEAQ